MAYIYKKTIHEKAYYYLRISKRIKGKIVVKDVAYLGNDASKIEGKLEKLPSIHKEDIRATYKNIKKFIQEEHYLKKIKEKKLKENTHLNNQLLEEVEAIKLHFNEEFLKRDKTTIYETYKDFLIDFAFNTTSLEGNTITLSEVNKLLKENLSPKNRTLREIYDVKNTEKVFFEIINSKRKISHDLIIEIHDKLLENIDDKKGYRTHDIRVFKSHFKATPFPYIKADIKTLLRWYKNNEKKLHPLVLAAIFHQKFEKIHPFADGNGRTGRILLCHMLMKRKCPPIIIQKSKRGKYLDALSKGNKADLNSNEPKFFRDLIGYLATEYISGYWNNFNI